MKYFLNENFIIIIIEGRRYIFDNTSYVFRHFINSDKTRKDAERIISRHYAILAKKKLSS